MSAARRQHRARPAAPEPGPRAETKALIRRILAMRQSGMTAEEIADVTDIHIGGIHRVLQSHAPQLARRSAADPQQAPLDGLADGPGAH